MPKLIKSLKQPNIWHYLIAFSSIVVLIIVLMGGYLFRMYYNTIYDDFCRSNEAFLSTISSRHENDMQVAKDIIAQMSLESDTINFRLQEQPIKSIQLKSMLHQYVSVSQFFNQILYVNHQDSYAFNHLTSIDIDRLIYKGLLFEQVTPEQLYTVLYDTEKKLTVLPEQGVGGYLAVAYGEETKRGNLYILPIVPKNIGVVAFLVRDSYYDGLMKCESGEKRQSLIFYEEQIVVQRGTREFEEAELLSCLADLKEGTGKVTLGGEKYLAVMRMGNSGLGYCTLQSMDIFTDKVLAGDWGVLLILLLCSIPAAIAIVGLSKSISTRIRRLNTLLSEKEDADYDLNTIEMGIKALVENNREVTKNSLVLMKTRFIRSFIREDYDSREAAVKAAEEAGLTIDFSWYLVVLMGDRGNSNENKAHSMMLDEISRESGIDGYGVTLLNNSQSLFVLFGNEPDRLEQMLQKMIVLGKVYCEDFVMAVSDIHRDFQEASKVYLEADTAFDNRFLMDNSKIIRFTEAVRPERIELIPNTYIKRLKNAIHIDKKEEVERIIEEICNKMKKENQTLLTFRLFYNDMIHVLIDEWNTERSDFRDVYNVFTLSQCLTIQDFNDVLCEVCDLLMNSHGEDGGKVPDLAAEAVAYMQDNYKNPDLNMGSLAEYLHVSPVTLAVEFKSGMGMSPSDYLASVRMEGAKELLKNTDQKVKEISLAVGYEDDHVFMRRFKKYTGKTPGQYRTEQNER